MQLTVCLAYTGRYLHSTSTDTGRCLKSGAQSKVKNRLRPKTPALATRVLSQIRNSDLYSEFFYPDSESEINFINFFAFKQNLYRIMQDLLKAAIPELLGSIKKGVEFANKF